MNKKNRVVIEAIVLSGKTIVGVTLHIGEKSLKVYNYILPEKKQDRKIVIDMVYNKAKALSMVVDDCDLTYNDKWLDLAIQ